MIATIPLAYSDYYAGFGAISLLLGILGFVKAKSIPSLVAGGISGIGLCAAAFVIARHVREGSSPTNGYILALVLSVLLLGKFLPSALKTKKLYPSGLMAALSLGGVVVAILALTSK